MATSRMLEKILLHPVSIILSVVAGVYLGFELPKESSRLLGQYGSLYLGLFEMCVLPVMIGAIVSSLGNLFLANIGNQFVVRLIVAFIVGLGLSALLALVVGLAIQPGVGLDMENKAILGGEVIRFEMSANSGDLKNQGFFDFVNNIIPNNVFYAAVHGKSLSLLFFSILLGVALGSCRTNGSEMAIAVATAVYQALLKIIAWLMYALPFGLTLIIAGQVAKMGIDLLVSMFELVKVIYAVALIILFIYTLVIWRNSSMSYWATIASLKSPLMIAFVTSSSYAAIPSALESLNKNFDLDRNKVDLVLPMGINLNPHGNVVHFVLAVVFVAQIYSQPLGLEQYLIIIVAGILAGIAAAGAPGLAALGMMSIVFDPLGLPVAIGIALLAAIDPIIDPILTLVNIHGNCATATVLSKPKSKR